MHPNGQGWQQTAWGQPVAKKRRPTVWPLLAVPVIGLLLAVVGYFTAFSLLYSVGFLLLVVGGVTGGIIAIVRSSAKNPQVNRPIPLAHSLDGRPIYPVVGHTFDGTPIYADRAVGYQPGNARTNSVAVAALIFGILFPLLAIPLGHVALSQISRTGEQGKGLAVAGLILGYLSLLLLALFAFLLLL